MYFFRCFPALGVLLAVTLQMGTSIGRQLTSAHWPLASTLTASSHTGQAGVLVSVWTGCPPLHLFSMFGGGRAWSIFRTHFSFLASEVSSVGLQ